MSEERSEYRLPWHAVRCQVVDSDGCVVCTCRSEDVAEDIASMYIPSPTLVPIELAQLKDTLIAKVIAEKATLEADNARLRDTLAAERTSHTDTRSRLNDALNNLIFED